MNLSIFQIVNYLLILILLVLFIRYLWIQYVVRDDEPVQWQYAVKNKLIPSPLKRIKRGYPDKVRFFNWWFQVERLKNEHVPGVFVELGVYKGDSARVIHHLDQDRHFHLFDTFSGFTAGDLRVETGEAATYTPDHFADTSIPSVLKRIGGNHNIIIHQGYFPESAHDFREQVSLVNMDADLYNPTRAGLEFFYPLLAPGGVMMVHDYNYRWPGIIKAVDDFVKTIPENPVLLPDVNGTMMIIRNK
ncbi:MAG: class I SAM-dependent methyltransferase [Bacteroidetes bacterium]|nr:class I SAM-dependent methyltransferase [Bacteroidota bacterium]